MPDVTRRGCSVKGCADPHYCRGWCRTHYNRWYRYGDPEREPYVRELAERIWEKIERVDGHWLWTGATDKISGYGAIQIGGRKGAPIKAHRVVYELLVEPIPDGLQIDHLCRVRNCVNPAHLEPVTAQENTRRGHGNASRTHCPSGHPYDDENTYVYGGRRYCRACNRRRVREWTARQRAA